MSPKLPYEIKTLEWVTEHNFVSWPSLADKSGKSIEAIKTIFYQMRVAKKVLITEAVLVLSNTPGRGRTYSVYFSSFMQKEILAAAKETRTKKPGNKFFGLTEYTDEKGVSADKYFSQYWKE
jgi:hypothetical protein